MFKPGSFFIDFLVNLNYIFNMRETSPAVLDFVTKIQTDPQSQMGYLIESISPELFQKMCYNIVEGVTYINYKYDGEVSKIELVDDDPKIFYDRNDDKIVISRGLLRMVAPHYENPEAYLNGVYEQRSKPYKLDIPRSLILLGAEEAFHAYQCKNPHLIENFEDHALALQNIDPLNHQEYYQNPIESHASIGINSAMLDMFRLQR